MLSNVLAHAAAGAPHAHGTEVAALLAILVVLAVGLAPRIWAVISGVRR